MKFTIVFLLITSNAVFGQSQSSTDSQIISNNVNLHSKKQWDSAIVNGDIDRVNQENLEMLDRFIDYDIMTVLDNQEHLFDFGEPEYLNYSTANNLLSTLDNHEVVSMYKTSKYDPDNKGIGYCFGRAMFAHKELSMRQFTRKAIKKAFVVGTMSTGGDSRWGWHVTTIAQSLDENGKEIWLALDPVTGINWDGEVQRPYTLKEWYKKMLTGFSVDGLLKIYITENTRFGPSPGGYDTQGLANQFYNNYFNDMDAWFKNESISGRYSGDYLIKPFNN